jgi:glycosyltransferase involved in cell wall biosynthesis
MYRNKRIALVIPAYNEEKLIGKTLQHIPETIDRIYVIDDCSPDNQNEVISRCAYNDKRIVLLKHETNQGPGGAIITGYRKLSEDNYDIGVVVGGDFQMSYDDLPHFLDPLVDGVVDYAKGNRFLLSRFEDTLDKMPRIRLIGNWIITALTKIASGYYKTMDVVDGYTAITKRAIDIINWKNAWKRYGYPMDFLIRLNAYGFRIADIPRTAIYLPGERQSQIKGLQYTATVSPMLIKNFFWRLKFKYLYLNFHPLVFFYYLSFILLPIGFCISIYLVIDWLFLGGVGVTGPRAIFAALLIITGLMFLLFAMLFDMEESK